MDYSTLKKKNKDDMLKLLSEKKSELKELEFKVSSQEVKNVRDVRKHKREIAQLLTALKENVI
jgi:ribosomal protein L29